MSDQDSTITIQQTFDLAREHHQSGRFADAENIYRSILSNNPDQPVALHLLGVIAHQVGKNEVAVDLIKRAVDLNTDYLGAQNSLGLVLQSLGKWSESISPFLRCVSINQEYADPHNSLGTSYLKLGDISNALASYRAAVSIQSNFIEARLNVATTLHTLKKLEDAEAECRKILSSLPNNYGALNLLGVLAQQTNRPVVAEEFFNKALKAKPKSPGTLSNLANLLTESGHPEKAIPYCQTAIEIDSNFAAAHYNLGNALRELERFEEAANHYNKTLQINSRFAEAYLNLGITYDKLSQNRDAISQYQKALVLRPHYSDAHTGIGHSLNKLGQFPEAKASFDRGFRMNHGGSWWNAKTFEEGERNSIPNPDTPFRPSTFKLQDNMDQLEHLVENGLIDRSFQRVVDRYQTVCQELRSETEVEKAIKLTPSQLGRLGASYDRVIHYVQAPRLPMGAVNPNLDFQSIENRYFASSLPVISFDNLLTEAALHELRKFCLESTIYFDFIENNFVASNIARGFNCDLLYQIAEELQRYFPKVLGRHRLSNMWTYRYNNATEGVASHTDEGAVTLNFWITPNDANLRPERGGLKVFPKEQPPDWNWRRYNSQKYTPEIRKEILQFLANVDPMTVPYQQNRATLFKSNLFHKSDLINFKQGFDNRRVNITMLFGKPDQHDEGVVGENTRVSATGK